MTVMESCVTTGLTSSAVINQSIRLIPFNEVQCSRISYKFCTEGIRTNFFIRKYIFCKFTLIQFFKNRKRIVYFIAPLYSASS